MPPFLDWKTHSRAPSHQLSDRIEAYRAVLRDAGAVMLRAAPLLEHLGGVTDVLEGTQLALAETIPHAEHKTVIPLRTTNARAVDCLLHARTAEAAEVQQQLRDAEARIQSSLQ